jgi:4-methylaminobutanoate oxidase (formaldehyde-forming)
MKKNIPFKGREAVAAQRANGVKKMMATFTTAPEVILNGRETIYRDGKRVGWLSSGGFGFTLNRSIGMGYVRNPEGVTADYVLSGRYELEVATVRIPAEVTLSPLFDPKMERIKA